MNVKIGDWVAVTGHGRTKKWSHTLRGEVVNVTHSCVTVKWVGIFNPWEMLPSEVCLAPDGKPEFAA